MRNQSTKDKRVSRIDVVPADKNRFKVLVNFVQRGVSYKTAVHANKEAETVGKTIPNVEIHLVNI